MSSALVVIQMALSLLLLISSGLFLRSLQSATQIDPGFEAPRNLAMASIDPSLQGYDEPRSREFWDRMLEDVASLPEVSDVALTLIVPLGLSSSDRSIQIPGYEFAEGERNSLHYTYVSEGYIEAMGIDVLEGRTFTRTDDTEGPPVMMVNERFANRFWPNETALGKTVTTAGSDWEIVGVVETGKYNTLGEDRASVIRLVLGEGLKLAVIGTALGVVGALGMSRLVQGLLYNVDALDPVAFTVVPALLLAVATVAVYLLARRAAAIDPMQALKTN